MRGKVYMRKFIIDWRRLFIYWSSSIYLTFSFSTFRVLNHLPLIHDKIVGEIQYLHWSSLIPIETMRTWARYLCTSCRCQCICWNQPMRAHNLLEITNQTPQDRHLFYPFNNLHTTISNIILSSQKHCRYFW